MSIESVIRGDLYDWHGLAKTETSATLTEALQPVKRVQDPVERDRHAQRYRVIVFERSTLPAVVEAWFLFNEDHASLIEYDNPPVQDLARTLEQYGPPELVLENKRYAEGAWVTEHVYASRGITLSVAQPVVDPEKTAKELIHLQLYPAMSTQNYLAKIGVWPQLRPYPGPRPGLQNRAGKSP